MNMRILSLLLAFAPLILAEGPEFDVASIKAFVRPGPNTPVFIGPARGGPGTQDPIDQCWQRDIRGGGKHRDAGHGLGKAREMPLLPNLNREFPGNGVDDEHE